jgi:putative Holliday junction resolvase
MMEEPGKILALDVGDKRVGVAVSDAAGWQARPVEILTRRSKREDFAAVARLVEEHRAAAIVVGYPLNMDGTRGPQARRVARYARELQQAVSVPVTLWDERLSSEEAAERLRAAGGSRRRRRRYLDDAAAAVILQEYLDAQANRPKNA